MQTNTGDLISFEELEKMRKTEPDKAKYYKVVENKNLTPQAIARRKVGRNEPCPCRSGKKFKKCCLGSIK